MLLEELLVLFVVFENVESPSDELLDDVIVELLEEDEPGVEVFDVVLE
jgi:hypothetical protein